MRNYLFTIKTDQATLKTVVNETQAAAMKQNLVACLEEYAKTGIPRPVGIDGIPDQPGTYWCFASPFTLIIEPMEGEL